MILFIDTEHTGFAQTSAERKLLSLAVVADDGRAEWYAEVDGWENSDCTPWVHRHVLPLMSGPCLSRDAARASLHDLFAVLPRRVQAACDSSIDWALLLGLQGERPQNLVAQRHDIAPLMDTAPYNHMVTAYFAKGHPEHHALHDARAYRLGWLAWMAAKGRS